MISIAQKYKKRKRKISKKSLIVAIIICIIISILLMIETLNKIKNNDIENITDNKPTQLDNNAQTIDNNKTLEDIYTKNNCERISEKYENNIIKVDIKFGKELYDNKNNSNEKYYENIIKDFAKKYKRDFMLVDKAKKIEITVQVESETDYTYSINGKEEYFKQADEKNKELNEYKEIETIENEISYSDFNKFDSNDWSVNAAGVEIVSRNQGVLNYGTYEVLTDNIFINTIILKQDFTESIIEGIKVGDAFDSIKSKLGEPQFQTNNMIGYKTNDEYIYFYEDQVAIYPNIRFLNFELENLIKDYIDGKYEQRKDFAFAILYKYFDFKSTIDENNTLILESPVRGIQIQISRTNEIFINTYNNYDITENTKKYIRENIINSKFNEDLTYINEINRIK